MTREESYYYGCVEQAGHYYWTPESARNRYRGSLDQLTPWGLSIDSKNIMPSHHKHGTVIMHDKDGYTAMAIADYSIDSRPGSKSVFIFKGVLSQEQSEELAERHFPSIWKRIKEYNKPYG